MVEQYADGLCLIRYHTWWPSQNDPFYQFNIPEMTARTNYYGADYVTHVYFDGVVDGGFDGVEWGNMFLERSEVPSPMELQITGAYNHDTREGNLVLYATATDEISLGDLRFHCVITESDIYWEAPNGLTIHNQTMRDMVPGAVGEEFVIESGETVTFERNFTLDELIDEANCEIAIFVQSNETKEVLQAAKAPLLELEPTGVDNSEELLPSLVTLDPAYPNPFNSSTKIQYSVPSKTEVNISVYDILGRKIATLIDKNQAAGFYQVRWDAAGYPSGIYLYRLDTGNYAKTGRVSLLK